MCASVESTTRYSANSSRKKPPTASPELARAGGTPIALVRTDAATIAAFSRTCPHQGGTVSASGGQFSCPLHGARFDLTTGARIGGQRTSNLTRYSSTFDATAGTVTVGTVTVGG